MSDSSLRIGITGASGYIAGKLICELQESAAADMILATDIRSPSVEYSSKVKFAHWDVSENRPDIFARHQVDTLIHLAYVLNPARQDARARLVNVAGTENALQASEQAGVRHVIYLSSTSVYGAHADNPELLNETDPVRPLEGFQYSRDKVAAESLVSEFASRNPEIAVTILRVCPVMGPNADNFIAKAFRKPLLPGIGSADPPMQFLHEDDIVQTLIRCLERRPRGIYNVGGDGAIRWGEMVAMMNRPVVRLPAPIWYLLTSAAWHLRLQSDSPASGLDFVRYRWTASTDKIRSAIGIEFRYSSRAAWESYTWSENSR
ncbi:MAG: NAD-dependent epimerase/dehydratase family protein [Dehalococcoidia bacterium]|nr:NAD-dependent epimerase/dehydratase family protein [Dehalococcoidia bacterium]